MKSLSEGGNLITHWMNTRPRSSFISIFHTAAKSNSEVDDVQTCNQQHCDMHHSPWNNIWTLIMGAPHSSEMLPGHCLGKWACISNGMDTEADRWRKWMNALAWWPQACTRGQQDHLSPSDSLTDNVCSCTGRPRPLTSLSSRHNEGNFDGPLPLWWTQSLKHRHSSVAPKQEGKEIRYNWKSAIIHKVLREYRIYRGESLCSCNSRWILNAPVLQIIRS